MPQLWFTFDHHIGSFFASASGRQGYFLYLLLDHLWLYVTTWDGIGVRTIIDNIDTKIVQGRIL